MSITTASNPRPAASNSPPSLASLIAQIDGDHEMVDSLRHDLCSALRTVARVLGRRSEEVPANPRYLREQLERLTPAMAGVSPGRWNNILSLTRRALKDAKLTTTPGRHQTPLSPEWTQLFELLSTRNARISLSRLAHYCSGIGLAPADVSDAALSRFLDDIENGGIVKRPREAQRKACCAWNRMAETLPDWPKQRLAIPNYQRRYTQPWEIFPQSLRDAIDAYLARLAGDDPFAEADFRPLKPRSIELRRSQIHGYISALVHRSRPPESLRTLADIVAVEAVKEGMRFLLERMGQKKSKHACDIAQAIRSMARHEVKVDAQHLTALKVICKQVDPGQQGMTSKNRARLRPFDDPANVQALVNLPQKIVARKSKVQSDVRRAREIQTALMIELLLMVPMRLGNLSRLDLAKNLIRSRGGKVVHLVIDGSDVKNDFDIEAILPESTVRLLDLYLDQHRGKLITAPSSSLFPGVKAASLDIGATRVRIIKCVRDECGLTVNPHLFRHIAAKIYLDANPGAYGVVRLINGHKRVETSTKYYCGTETPAALRHYDDLIVGLQRSHSPTHNRKPTRIS